MIRPKLNIFNKKNDIYVQLNDWRSYDIVDDDNEDSSVESDEEYSYNKKIKKKYSIMAYGTTIEGLSISIHITNFTPYFFIEIPKKWTQKDFKEFKYKFKRLSSYHEENIADISIVMRIPFYNFTNNTKSKYIRIVFDSIGSYYTYLRKIRETNNRKMQINKKKYDFSKKLYESKVNPLLRYFHIKELEPVGWIQLKAGKYKMNIPSKTRCQIDCTIHYNDVLYCKMNAIGKYVILSFDIECKSEDGSFPNADKPNDILFQIGTSVRIFGTEKTIKYIATLKKCNPIEDIIVEEYETEKKLILGWCDFVRRVDPDIITGYNIWGFDWKYIYDRAKNGKYLDMMLRRLTKLKDNGSETFGNNKVKGVKYVERELKSSALGHNFLRYIDIDGIVQIDLYKLIQKDYKLNSYKLDNVSKHFMGKQKEDLSPKQLFKNYEIGTKDAITEIAIYCVKDCTLCNDLIDKLQVIPNNVGMGNVCCIPFSYLFLRGQGIKIFSLVVKQCRKEGFLIKDLQDSDIDKNSYEGAIVFDPNPGIYFEPVAVMDFESLYPSSMIAENISHDSIVGFQEFKMIRNKKTNKIEYELTKDTINKKYDNLEGFNYNNIIYDIYKGIGNDKKKVGYKLCRYTESKTGEKSILPRILMDLLKARKDTRKKIKYKTIITHDNKQYIGLLDKDEEKQQYMLNRVDKTKDIVNMNDVKEIKDTYSYFEKAVLDGQQLAFKVTCNSLYGQVGASTSSICYKELAASTTATGRKMVTLARDYTLNKYDGSKLVYGDSVTGDEPLLLKRDDGTITIKTIESLTNEWKPYKEFKPFDTNRNEKQQSLCNYKVFSYGKWTKIKRVIRHKTNKIIYRINTNNGIVDVTEDHSLLDENIKKIKPNECIIGKTKLLQSYPDIINDDYTINKDEEMVAFMLGYYYRGKNNNNECLKLENIDNILNGNYNIRFNFLLGYCNNRYKLNKNIIIDIKGKIGSAKLYYLMKSIGYYINISESNNIYKLICNFNQHDNLQNNLQNTIININKINEIEDNEYVYDLETEEGCFQAGIGEIIVKNTDSVFINFTDYIKNKYKKNYENNKITDEEMLKLTISVGEEAGAYVTSKLKHPQNLEYEKVFWPFIIFSKKRYVGNKYEFSTKKFKQTSMGIVLKRRDNAPIVKDIY